MMASIVAPLGCRSRPSTVSCLDDGPLEVREVVPSLFGDLAAGDWRLGVAVAAFAAPLTTFDLDLVLGHLALLSSMTASCAATETSPVNGGAESAKRWRLAPLDSIHQADRIVQATCIIKQLVHVHGNLDALMRGCQLEHRPPPPLQPASPRSAWRASRSKQIFMVSLMAVVSMD